MAPIAPEWLIVRASRLIDGTDAPSIDRPTVVVRRGVVDAIYAGSAPRGNWPADAPELDLTGHTLLPGLIDAHVHLVLPGDGTPFEDSVREPDGVLLATAIRNAQIALRAGITTLRDCGACAIPRLSCGGRSASAMPSSPGCACVAVLSRSRAAIAGTSAARRTAPRGCAAPCVGW